MAGIQRMIKSGIRLCNYNARDINFASPINRLGAAANPYRSLWSSSCGDGYVKRTFNVDTSAMVNFLKAEGVPIKKAKGITRSMTEFLAELEKNPAYPAHPRSTLLKSKFKSLQKNIKIDEFTPITPGTTYKIKELEWDIIVFLLVSGSLIIGMLGCIIHDELKKGEEIKGAKTERLFESEKEAHELAQWN